jgi:DNA excision repair protein ERCC-6
VLFCRLTERQRQLYVEYLMSRQCESILAGRVDAFAGLILLRKLCNHADLVAGAPKRELGMIS